jgi:hypothetical protein
MCVCAQAGLSLSAAKINILRACVFFIGTHRESGEGHLHVGVDQILHLAGECSFHVRHYGGVHLWQAVRPVDAHHEARPLPLHRHPLWQQKVPVEY